MNGDFQRQFYQPVEYQGLKMGDVSGARRIVYPSDGVSAAKLGFSPFSRGAVRAVLTDLPNTSFRDGMVWRQLQTPPNPASFGPPRPSQSMQTPDEVKASIARYQKSLAKHNSGSFLSKVAQGAKAGSKLAGRVKMGGLPGFIIGTAASVGLNKIADALTDEEVPQDVSSQPVQTPVGVESVGGAGGSWDTEVPTVATGLANTVAQIPQQLPEIVDAQQAMNAMAGNAAPAGAVPANATPVTQGLGNIRVPSMRNIDAIRKQKQRQEATRRAVQQSIPPQMGYTMQPTVSVQPYGNGGTQFNLNKNTMMFDDPDYQRLYALRAQQAQQALANTNQPVTYDQALAHARAGTTWR